MANKQIEMRKVKKIFKLYSEGVSKRQISLQLGLSRNTVTKYIVFFQRFKLTSYEVSAMSVEELHKLFNTDQIGEMLNAKFFIHPIDFVGMQRVEKDEYPVAAIREMILNALVHRNYLGAPTQIRLYGDSFSIWNDGSLPEGITEEDLKKVHRSKPRNPLIADVCFRGGYIDSWGRGTIKIIEACKDAELPEPVLKEEQGGFLSKILKDRFTKDQLKKLGLHERQIEAVVYTKEHNFISNADYQKLNDVGKTTATEELSELVALGIFTAPTAKGRGAKYTLH